MVIISINIILFSSSSSSSSIVAIIIIVTATDCMIVHRELLCQCPLFMIVCNVSLFPQTNMTMDRLKRNTDEHE